MFAMANLSKDMKNILIRPETLLDKIWDIFSRTDIDFEEHKGFSNKYCLFSKDKAFVKQNLSPKFLEEVYRMNKLYLEFYDNMVIGTFNKKIIAEDTMNLAAFMEKIVPLFGQ